MKKLILFCTLFLVAGSAHGMRLTRGGDDSGTMSLPANARSICNGLENVLKSVEPLNSSLAVWLWDNATRSKNGLLDSSNLRDPLVVGSIAGGLIGTAVHATVTEESLNKTSPLIRPFVKVAVKHSFLVTRVGLRALYGWNEIKQNPWPFAAELGLIGLHLYNESIIKEGIRL